MSMSPEPPPEPASPHRSQPEIQSTKWPPSPDNQHPPTAAAEIVAEAKAKISRWSIGQVTDDAAKEQKSSVTAPAKTKFVPKAAAKFDSRQAALNKLAAKRIALAKSKAKAGLNFNSKLSSPSKVDEAKAIETKTMESKPAWTSSIQISLSSLSNRSSSLIGNSSVSEKPTASIAPIMSSTTNQTPVTVATVSMSHAAPVIVPVSPLVTAPNEAGDNAEKVEVLPPPSSQMLQAMQATLLSPQQQPQVSLQQQQISAAGMGSLIMAPPAVNAGQWVLLSC